MNIIMFYLPKRFLTGLLLVFSLSGTSGYGATPARPETSVIWARGENNVVNYRIPASAQGAPSTILFSFPARNRSDGMVYASRDDHRSWFARKLAVPGRFGYSNLDRLPTGEILMIYETDAWKQVNLLRFSLDWVTQEGGG